MDKRRLMSNSKQRRYLGKAYAFLDAEKKQRTFDSGEGQAAHTQRGLGEDRGPVLRDQFEDAAGLHLDPLTALPRPPGKPWPNSGQARAV